ncbi:MAG: NAD(P)-dependent oxidoreductase [Chloroflexi bacterium]|nr:NAD(P)-dependent oxidoreductase [Chloroflexota bacterium]
MSTEKTVGFIGLGIMGAPMVRNLAKAGFQVVAWNRTRSKAEALQGDGITLADSPKSVGEACPVVITMVSDTPDLVAVTEGPDGVSEGLSAGSILIDMSTVAPGATRELAERLGKRGISMLDAPVSGGSTGAQQATLAIMVGGKEEAFQRCLPIFQAMGKTITHMGPSGMGQTTKLVNQILVVGTLSTVAEALTFAAAHGADLLRTIEAVAGGAAGSWQLQNLGSRMVEGDFAPGFMVRLQRKDLRLITEAAHEKNVPLPISSVAKQFYAAAEAAGYGEEGTQAIVKVFQRLAGVQVSR